MNTFDANVAPIAAYLCILAFAYLTWRHPAGLCFSTATIRGIAWVPIVGINYARLLVIMQAAAFLFLLWRLTTGGGLSRFFNFFRTRYSIPLWLLLVLWAKVAADVALHGLNEYSSLALKLSLSQIAFPTFFVLFSVAQYGVGKSIRDYIWGMWLFGAAYLVPVIQPIIAEQRIGEALFAGTRLTIYGLDTINSGTYIMFGALGLVGFIMLEVRRPWLTQIGWAGVAILSGLLYLNGTRQYLLALVLAAFLCLYTYFRNKSALALLILGSFIALGGLTWDYLRDAEVRERFTREAVTREIEASRGEIWRQAMLNSLENPVLGSGFKQYGETVYRYNEETGVMDAQLDGAHGFFQDIFAEHGLIFGSLALLGFLLCLKTIITQINPAGRLDLWVFGVFYLALVPTYLFSGSLADSTGPYLLAAGMMGFYMVHHETMPVWAMGWGLAKQPARRAQPESR